MGRLRIWAVPSIVKIPDEAAAHKAVIKRAVVPARPTNSSAFWAGILPPWP